MINRLSQIISPYLDPNLGLVSRIHKTNSYFESNEVYIKRDDELSSGVIGTKWRKYASLIPAIKRKGQPILVIGSYHSNNVLGLSQLLIENQIEFKVLVKATSSKAIGNGAWLKMLAGDRLIEIETENWAATLLYVEAEFPEHFIIPEGASIAESVPGLLSLALDIREWEKSSGIVFNHIYIDSGTGLSAACLELGLACTANSSCKLTVTHIAGNPEEYGELRKMASQWMSQNGLEIGTSNIQVQHQFPSSSKSFGSSNATLVNEWRKIISQEGIIADLIYTVKHFYTIKECMRHNDSRAKVLIVYTGGSFAARNHESLLFK